MATRTAEMPNAIVEQIKQTTETGGGLCHDIRTRYWHGHEPIKLTEKIADVAAVDLSGEKCVASERTQHGPNVAEFRRRTPVKATDS